MKSVGQNIKKIRKEKGVTQEEMAKILGISRSYLANLEAGRKNVGENTINKMAEKSGMSVYYLTTGNKTVKDVMNSNNLIELQNHMDGYDPLVVDNIRETFSNIVNVDVFKNLNLNQEKKLKERLTELINIKLSFIEVIILNHTIDFFNNSNFEDKKTLASLLVLFNSDNDPSVNNLATEEEILKEIDFQLEKTEEMLKNRFSPFLSEDNPDG